MLATLSLPQIAVITAILLVAGLTKGVLGAGLPLVAVPLLSQVLPVPQAIMTLAIATVLSNGYQAFQGGNLIPVLRRFWTLLLPLFVGLALGARLLITLDEKLLSLILGLVLLVFTALNRIPWLASIGPRQERILSPLVGTIAGVLGGISSFYGPPVLMYMVALRLEKEFFISAISVAFFLGSVPLVGALAFYGAFDRDMAIFSALSAVPVFLGLLVGQLIQARMPQAIFRQGLFLFMIAMGLSLVLRGLLA